MTKHDYSREEFLPAGRLLRRQAQLVLERALREAEKAPPGDPILLALLEGAQQYACGEISTQQWIDWIEHILEPVVLCPWCGDWEEVSEAEIRNDRLWCCGMCSKSAERAGQVFYP